MRTILRRGTVVAVLAGLLATTAFAQGTTLWLVRPLYPGQEALVERTEKALDKLMPGEARKEAVIGVKELAATLKGRKADDLPCFTADSRCADPIDPFVAGLGFDRVVLVQGGQDEVGVKFRVAAYEPKTGKTTSATSTNAVLEKALLGAVAKVVPVASTLEVKSTPPGAMVFVDDVKVGVTPLTTQVLPGERIVRVDLKLHQPLEEAIIIPIRGTATLDKTLEKVAARIVITASPTGTNIAIDGAVLGKDKVDRGITPGTHTIRLTAENHRDYEQQITVKAEEQFSLDKTLEPVAGLAHGVAKDGTLIFDRPVAPPPATGVEAIYERKAYFQASYEYSSILGNTLVGRRWGNSGTGRTTAFSTPSRLLMGVGAEYGIFGRYFGVTVIGLSYLTNVERMALGVGYTADQGREVSSGVIGPATLDPVRVHLVTIRAIQPQFRFAFWKVMLSIQLGLEFRTGQILGTSDTFYKDGFMLLDLLASARLNARVFVYDGLYFFGSGNFTYLIAGQTATDESGANYAGKHQWGFNVGVGYAF